MLDRNKEKTMYRGIEKVVQTESQSVYASIGEC